MNVQAEAHLGLYFYHLLLLWKKSRIIWLRRIRHRERVYIFSGFLIQRLEMVTRIIIFILDWGGLVFSRPVDLNLFGIKDGFHGRQFFHGLGGCELWGETVNIDEVCLLTSCFVALFLIAHWPLLICGLGIQDPCSRPHSDLFLDFFDFLHALESGSETEGKGAGHNLWQNDTSPGQDINWLESNGSKMADKLTRSWVSVYSHCNTSVS